MTAILRLHERLAARDAASSHFGWLVRAERLVAVKRLHPLHVADEAMISRVREDARRAMGVDHPNVVTTLGLVRPPGEVLAAMEYVPGASLAEIAEASPGGLEAHVATAIAAGALRGIHAAHEARAGAFVPRAVSPSRVLVGEDGVARVRGFEIAEPSTADAVVGALPYAAPEQLVRGRETAGTVDVRRDVYALSVVLWETLTGRALFPMPTVEATLRRILGAAVPAPSRLASGVGPELDAIVLRGLARDPEVRFASARAMAFELESATCASPGDVAKALTRMDLPCIRRRRALADGVRRREVNPMHFECTRSASKR